MSILSMYQNSTVSTHPQAGLAKSIPGQAVNYMDKNSDIQRNFTVDALRPGEVTKKTNYTKKGLEYYNAEFAIHKIPPATWVSLDPSDTSMTLNRYRPSMTVTLSNNGRTVSGNSAGVTYYSAPGSKHSNTSGFEGRL